MAAPQHLGSPVSWHVAVDEELRHLRRNLTDAGLAAGLYTLLDTPVTRPGLPDWMVRLSPDLRSPAARAARAGVTALYALLACVAAAAVAPAGDRLGPAAVAGLAVALALTLVVEVPLRRARPVELRTDAARYLVAEALLAARDIAAGPAGPALAPAVDALLQDVLRSVRRLDAGPYRAGGTATSLTSTASRHAWLLEQVAALRVTAQRADGRNPDDVVLGI
jgi:MFS family permease